jgi:hypothetical protein
MSVHKKTKGVSHLISNLQRREMRWYTSRLKRKRKRQELKAEMQDISHSLFWVWEFSKKAVLICFLFYIIVQVYSMTVMLVYTDFTYLGDLITETGSIVRDCVFAYLVKAGLENVGKIWFTSLQKKWNETSNDGVDDNAVG